MAGLEVARVPLNLRQGNHPVPVKGAGQSPGQGPEKASQHRARVIVFTAALLRLPDRQSAVEGSRVKFSQQICRLQFYDVPRPPVTDDETGALPD